MGKKIKILHVITSLNTGGAEKLMVDLLPRLRNNEFDVDLCIFNNTETIFKKQLEESGIRIIGFGNGSVYNPKYIYKLFRLMRNYDIVHTHNTAPQLFAAIASLLCSVGLITTEHNTSNRRRNWKWYVPFDKWMYSRYKKIICCSRKAQINLEKIISKTNKCITINNGVNIAAFKQANTIPGFRDKFPKNSRLITMVAGFRWEKDQDTLIKSLQFLDDKYHVLLVGDGTRRSELEKLVSENNLTSRVHFLGFRSDIPGILKSSDYIVMSSHFEGLSLSSVEGMSVGKPMLASNVDGLKQVIEGAGILFPEGNSEELAKCIISLEEDSELYRSIANSCGERAAEYDISKMVANYKKVYKSFL